MPYILPSKGGEVTIYRSYDDLMKLISTYNIKNNVFGMGWGGGIYV